jgi:hypothetical protein
MKKLLLISSFLLLSNNSYSENISLYVNGQGLPSSGARTTAASSLNTFDASGNPCTISTTPNCGLYTAVNAFPSGATTVTTNQTVCLNPSISSLCTFRPISYDGVNFSTYASSNNILKSGTTQYQLGSTTSLYNPSTSTGTTLTYSPSSNGISISGGNTYVLTRGPTANISSIDVSNFDNSTTLDLYMSPWKNDSIGGPITIPTSLVYTSTGSTTSGTTTPPSTTNTSTATNSQTPQRAKKICLMRMKLFNVVP